MAIKYECDRCGSQHLERLGKIEIPLTNHYGEPYDNGDTTTKDLCNDCLKQLNDFLKRLPDRL